MVRSESYKNLVEKQKTTQNSDGGVHTILNSFLQGECLAVGVELNLLRIGWVLDSFGRGSELSCSTASRTAKDLMIHVNSCFR